MEASPTAPALVSRRRPAQLAIGFIPLVDSAPLVVAAEKGFAKANDLRLKLVRETSWANIRDRVMLGHFDAAHMLGPLPIASTLGLGGHVTTPMIAPFALGYGGNAITVSTALWRLIEEAGCRIGDAPGPIAAALARVVAARHARGEEPLTFAMVYPFSGHNYELRYWLASAGIDPDRDIRLVVLPPPFMADAMREGQIDAFCVGEPWNSLAVESGHGVIAATKSALWRQGPEKVLGLRARFADQAPERLAALLRALYEAAKWADDPANHDELAELLARESYVGAAMPILRRILANRLALRASAPPVTLADFIGFHDHAANFPWQSHALWYFSQMVRWGQTTWSATNAALARSVYRPDLFRAALKGTDADIPGADAKVEGALARPTHVGSRHGQVTLGPDGFFDGIPFDPDDVEGYIRRLGVAV